MARYDPQLMRSLYYRDERARKSHHCGFGGSNVPALNRQLLARFGLGFKQEILVLRLCR